MKSFWRLSTVFLVLFATLETNGDSYHQYRVIRRICPSGSYHDPIKDRCRRVPGGGKIIEYDFDARCSGGYVGIMAHSRKSRVYFVCKSYAVLTCACKVNERFDRICLRCAMPRNFISKKERIAHTVIDNILDKYNCVYNDFSSEAHRPQELPPTERPSKIRPAVIIRTESPVQETTDNDHVAGFKKFLNDLKDIKTVYDQWSQSISNEPEIEGWTTENPNVNFKPRKFVTEISIPIVPESTLSPNTEKGVEVTTNQMFTLTPDFNIPQVGFDKNDDIIPDPFLVPKTETSTQPPTPDIPNFTDKVKDSFAVRRSKDDDVEDNLTTLTPIALTHNDRVLDQFVHRKTSDVSGDFHVRNVTINDIKEQFPDRFNGTRSSDYDFNDDNAKDEHRKMFVEEYYIDEYYYDDKPNETLWSKEGSTTQIIEIIESTTLSNALKKKWAKEDGDCGDDLMMETSTILPTTSTNLPATTTDSIADFTMQSTTETSSVTTDITTETTTITETTADSVKTTEYLIIDEIETSSISIKLRTSKDSSESTTVENPTTTDAPESTTTFAMTSTTTDEPETTLSVSESTTFPASLILNLRVFDGAVESTTVSEMPSTTLEPTTELSTLSVNVDETTTGGTTETTAFTELSTTGSSYPTTETTTNRFDESTTDLIETTDITTTEAATTTDQTTIPIEITTVEMSTAKAKPIEDYLEYIDEYYYDDKPNETLWAVDAGKANLPKGVTPDPQDVISAKLKNVKSPQNENKAFNNDTDTQFSKVKTSAANDSKALNDSKYLTANSEYQILKEKPFISSDGSSTFISTTTDVTSTATDFTTLEISTIESTTENSFPAFTESISIIRDATNTISKEESTNIPTTTENSSPPTETTTDNVSQRFSATESFQTATLMSGITHSDTTDQFIAQRGDESSQAENVTALDTTANDKSSEEVFFDDFTLPLKQQEDVIDEYYHDDYYDNSMPEDVNLNETTKAKPKRDKSDEYYVDSMSASLENRLPSHTSNKAN